MLVPPTVQQVGAGTTGTDLVTAWGKKSYSKPVLSGTAVFKMYVKRQMNTEVSTDM